MKSQEFHQAFIELCGSFPLVRIGDNVENAWFKRLSRFPFFKIKSAFSILAMEDRFPTLARAYEAAREASDNRVRYVSPEWGFCYKLQLGDGPVRCGCSECRPDLYQQFSRDYHDTYGRYPWDRTNEDGKWTARAAELAKSPGGIQGFRQLTKELESALTSDNTRKRESHGFTKAAEIKPFTGELK